MFVSGDDLEKRLEQTTGTAIKCPNCGNTFTFQEGVEQALAKGIRDKVLVCPKCKTTYRAEATLRGVQLLGSVQPASVAEQVDTKALIEWFEKSNIDGWKIYSIEGLIKNAKKLLQTGDEEGQKVIIKAVQSNINIRKLLAKELKSEPESVRHAIFGTLLSDPWVRINQWSTIFFSLIIPLAVMSYAGGLPILIMSAIIVIPGLIVFFVSNQKVAQKYPGWGFSVFNGLGQIIRGLVIFGSIFTLVAGQTLGELQPFVAVVIALVGVAGLLYYSWYRIQQEYKSYEPS